MAIWLLIDRVDCRDEFFIVDFEIFFGIGIVLATFIQIGGFIFPFTRHARTYFSKERMSFTHGIFSLFFSLHLLPLIMIDDDCDAINPVFGDDWEASIFVP